MRSSLRFAFLSLIGATLVACSDRDLVPTGLTPREANKDFVNLTIDPNQFVGITAGNDFTCAVQNSGNVYCWGKADYGQPGRLATGTCFHQISRPPCVPRPSLVKKPGSGTPLLATIVDAGGYHACAVERQTYQVWCWGAGGVGQLGFNGQAPTIGDPAAVPGMTNVSLMSAGGYASCAQKPDGMFCWGRLNISTPRSPFPADALAPVQWDIEPDYVDLSVGTTHACAIHREENTVVCWGDNDYGQAATGSKNPNRSQIVGTLFGSFADRVVTQNNTTCVERNGATQCAGQNWYGMFGNTTALGAWTETPQTRNGPPLFNITVGEHHACGLDATGAAFCWGYNAWGQLGNNDPAYASTTVPQAVVGGGTYRAIAAGANHTCAIRTDNVLYCWGQNSYGQLGAWVLNSRVPVPTDALQQ